MNMIKRTTKLKMAALATICLGLLCSTGPDALGIAVSQSISTTNPIVNEFGEVLPGTTPNAGDWNNPVVEGFLVEILMTTDGAIYPPSVDGTPDPRNVLLETSRIGMGTSPSLAESGKFGLPLSPRPDGSTRIFARVFNAREKADASFYGDSQLFTVLSYKNTSFHPDIQKTDLPLDPADDDGDGLNNSWEDSYGTDKDNMDSDGDGMTDGEEFVTKTDMLDEASKLVITKVLHAGGDDAILRWESVPGVKYVIQYSDISHDVDTYTYYATMYGALNLDRTELVIPGGMTHPSRCFRVMAEAEN